MIIPEADAIHQGAPESDPTFQLALRVFDKGTGFIVLNHGRAERSHGRSSPPALLRAAGELDRPDLKSIPVIGGDGLPEIGMLLVKQGILTATVRVTLPGKPAIALLERFWRDGTAMAAVTSLPVESHPALAALAQLSA